MTYPTTKAPEGTKYRAKLNPTLEARGTVETCDHAEGTLYCVSCDALLRDRKAKALHLTKRPKRGAAHLLALWCDVCDEPTVLAYDPLA